LTDLLDQSATAQLAAMRAGQLSPSELMAMTLNRIEARNGAVNAIVALQDRDTLIAAAQSAPEGPLQGLPMAVKDLAETRGIPTTYGSPLFKDHVPAADSPMVARLRAAGAVIIGKTNTPEWGLGSHSFNPVYGTTLNPYDLSKSAGGSSGGAAVALATGMLALADGSDMMGSLRNPAGWNNVFGFRPSYGLVPNSGPGDIFSNQLSTNGPMARHVADLELLLTVMGAYDPRHPHSCGPYRAAPLGRPLKIGWLANWGCAYPMEDGVLAICEAALQQLEQLGHEVISIPPPMPTEALWESWTVLRSAVMAAKLGPLFADPTKRALLKPEAIWEVEQGLNLPASALHRASEIRSDWFRWTAEMPVDILSLPSAQLFPFPANWTYPTEVAGVAMDTYHRWMEVVIPASLTGLPAISVPAGLGPSGMPMGLQLFAHRGQDAMVLALAAAQEELIGAPQLV
jgi:amidase